MLNLNRFLGIRYSHLKSNGNVLLIDLLALSANHVTHTPNN